MLVGPVVLYGAIGVASATRQPLDYFAAGRRVPAVFTGLALAITALGSTGLVALTGVFFVSGFDGLAITIGALAGFVAMAILLAPFLRKFGAYTIPTYLGRRFDSRMLRLVSALFLAVPLLLLIAAELRIASAVASWLSGGSQALPLMLFATFVLASLVGGGMRGLSWSNAAQAITVMLAFLVPVAMVAVIVNKLPIPQLSYGPIVRTLLKQEAALALTVGSCRTVFIRPSRRRVRDDCKTVFNAVRSNRTGCICHNDAHRDGGTCISTLATATGFDHPGRS